MYKKSKERQTKKIKREVRAAATQREVNWKEVKQKIGVRKDWVGIGMEDKIETCTRVCTIDDRRQSGLSK